MNSMATATFLRRGLVGLSLLLWPALAPAQVPVGVEFQMNEVTAGGQTAPRTARHADGRFVVVWESPTASGLDIVARLFDADGLPVTGDFRVNTYTPSHQYAPATAAAANGEFVVVWTSVGQDGSLRGVFGQRLGANGAPLGSEFAINTQTLDRQWWPRVATAPSGDFVVVWDSQGQDGHENGIFGQCFTSDGARRGLEFQVNSYTTGYQYLPDVAVNGTGEFVVAWTDYPRERTYARRFAAHCAPIGSEFEAMSPIWATIGMDPAGNFALAGVEADGDSMGVWTRLFGPDGSPRTGTFPVNAVTAGEQTFPDIDMGPRGDFVVTWDTYDYYNFRFDDASARVFRADGTPAGAQFAVATYTTGAQGFPDVMVDGRGDFLVVWSGAGPTDEDGIHGRQFLGDLVFADGFE
jgi:hypothetical protein